MLYIHVSLTNRIQSEHNAHFLLASVRWNDLGSGMQHRQTWITLLMHCIVHPVKGLGDESTHSGLDFFLKKKDINEWIKEIKQEAFVAIEKNQKNQKQLTYFHVQLRQRGIRRAHVHQGTNQVQPHTYART